MDTDLERDLELRILSILFANNSDDTQGMEDDRITSLLEEDGNAVESAIHRLWVKGLIYQKIHHSEFMGWGISKEGTLEIENFKHSHLHK